MSLTALEQKKMEKIQELLLAKQQELDALKAKSAQGVAELAMQFQLWKLDQATLTAALEAIAKQHKTID